MAPTLVPNFSQQTAEEEPTILEGEISGLAEGKHGISINVWGDTSEDATSTGGHFNPFGKNHGAPEDEERHVGSLGNIEADSQGVARVRIEDRLGKLIGPQSIIGRSIVIASGEDDLGKGGHELSLTTGNSGPAAAWGVVGITHA